MDIKKLKDEFGELTVEEKQKIDGWIVLARKILSIRGQKKVEEYIRERLREYRRLGGGMHESEK